MTRLFTASGEERELYGGLWDTTNSEFVGQGMFGMTVVDGNDAAEIVEPHTGLGCYKFFGDNDFLRKEFPAHPTNVWISFYMFMRAIDNGEQFLQLSTSAAPPGNDLNLRMSSGGIITAYRGGTSLASSTTVFSLDTWHHILVHFIPLNAAGTLDLWLDGGAEIAYSGDTADSQEYMSAFTIKGAAVSGDVHAFDDIVINDTAGADNNGSPGAARLLPIRPAGVGASTQWTRAGVDFGSNWLQASQLGDMAVLQTAVISQQDMFSVEVPDLPVGATIQNIIVQANAEVGVGAGDLKVGLEVNGDEDLSSDFSLTSARRMYTHVVPDNPDTLASWVEADLADLEIGIESA